MRKTKSQQQVEEMFCATETHRVWHQFSNWLVRAFGHDLHGEWQTMKVGKNSIRYRGFNEVELSRRLCGYETMMRIERYIKRYCPEIKIIRCDDDVHSGSNILLIPHPKMGITVMFIPQCTNVQNRFFLYKQHCDALMKGLKEMSNVYKGAS